MTARTKTCPHGNPGPPDRPPDEAWFDSPHNESGWWLFELWRYPCGCHWADRSYIGDQDPR